MTYEAIRDQVRRSLVTRKSKQGADRGVHLSDEDLDTVIGAVIEALAQEAEADRFPEPVGELKYLADDVAYWLREQGGGE